MIKLPGYRLTSQIYESNISLVYRAYREEDQQPVILKVLKQDYPPPAELTRFNQEYEITQSLNLEGVIKTYGIQNYQNTRVIVLEDFGGESLNRWMSDRILNLREFLFLSIRISDILGAIHQRNIIHKDINPANIVFNPETDQLKVIDFGISTILLRENPGLKNPNILEGTLAYMSPEQTGRMNRSIDYRTDLYSLGVTLYELLTHHLPFETNDVLELVHCHIARQPTPPCELESNIPKSVSDIVLKLLAKTAEERYQSAYGLKTDLQRCLTELTEKQRISIFPLGQRDVSDRFQISQKLYGREIELQALLTAFERVAKGQSELMLVSGYSGIGKSALVQEIYKPITRQRGYFISGKFDQFQRNIPYISIIQAFQELIRQLLTETAAQIETWRARLLTVLGDNGQVIAEVIPEIELIIGKQPTVPELAPAEAQNRFNRVFQNFIRVFVQPDHPLVMFLDDLQWADSASLKLIELLIAGAENRWLFLIGAYRDNEVSPTHPLMITLDRVRQAGSVINQVSLTPLNLADVNQLIADTLHRRSSDARPLAELVLQKTNGNPFFMSQFLKSLHTEMLLKFDFDRSEWYWELEQIQSQDITDNVVELMAGKILKLQPQAQEVLKLAACIGNQFDLKTLAIVHENSLLDTANHLWQAIAEGLILPIDDNYKFVKLLASELANQNLDLSAQMILYKFLHDRVQQAAYSLIPAGQKQALHLKIGQLLLKNTPAEQWEESIFDLVSHLNRGIDLMTSQAEREQVIRLNLLAGKKAKASAAYEPAFDYFSVGLGLLNPDAWQQQYDLAIAVHTEAAEAAYLSGNFEEMERLVAIVLQQAQNRLEKVRVFEVKVQAYTGQGKLLEAIDTALVALKLLGINFPKKVTKFDVLLGLFRLKLLLIGKRIEDLVDLPAMTDRDKLAAIRLLSDALAAAYLTSSDLVPLIVFKQVELSVQYGNAPESAHSYSLYGLVLCGIVGDIDSGYRFGQLALNLLERFNSRKLKTKVLFVVMTFVKAWKEHIKTTLEPFLEGYQSGLDTGDLVYAAYSLYCHSTNSALIGTELSELEQSMASRDQTFARLKQELSRGMLASRWQMTLNLLGKSENIENIDRLVGKAYDEQSMLPYHLVTDDRCTAFQVYLHKTLLCYLFYKFRQALENLKLAEQHLVSVIGSQHYPLFYLLDSLVQLALYAEAQATERKQILKQVRTNQKKMKRWAYHAPMNNLHKWYLVEAECHRVRGQSLQAMAAYDRSIALAKEHEFIHEEGLAHELAARFYLESGKQKIAQVYILDARYCYLRWGAAAKVKELDQRYSQLISAPVSARSSTTSTIARSIVTTTNNSSSDLLDVATITKASKAIFKEIRLDQLLARLLQLLLENAGAEKGSLILSREDELLIAAEGTAIDTMEAIVLQSIPVKASQTLCQAIVNYVERTQTDVVLGNAAQEGLFTTDTYVVANQLKSVLCFPILSQGKLIGILYLENNLTTDAFTRDRLEVVSVLSSQAAIALENALLYQTLEQKVEDRTAQLAQANEEIVALNDRLKAENLRMKTEIDIARQLQRMILPKEEELQQIEGLKIAGFMQPADEVGGDYYDVLQQNGITKIGIGDVTGHGLESGVLMLMVQTAVRSLLNNQETDPARFLNAINRTIYDNARRMNCNKIMTLTLLDYEQGQLHITGQHEEILLVRTGGQVECIDTMDLGFPLGLLEDITDLVDQTVINLAPGEGVVLYTDGITEAENSAKKLYGLHRLCQIIEQNWQYPVERIRQTIVQDIQNYIGDHKIYDDITLLVIKRDW